MNEAPTMDTGQLILAVTGHSPRSNRARANLSSFLLERGYADVQLSELDLLEHPEKTIEWGVFASPALVYEDSAGKRHILYGDLSETKILDRFFLDCQLAITASR